MYIAVCMLQWTAELRSSILTITITVHSKPWTRNPGVVIIHWKYLLSYLVLVVKQVPRLSLSVYDSSDQCFKRLLYFTASCLFTDGGGFIVRNGGKISYKEGNVTTGCWCPTSVTKQTCWASHNKSRFSSKILENHSLCIITYTAKLFDWVLHNICGKPFRCFACGDMIFAVRWSIAWRLQKLMVFLLWLVLATSLVQKWVAHP